ncbi:uracil-DNA glycosylase [Pseudemcibacter aquimaris]|uniref:uracil-DNA glycosylase n=1 Tax=Pseudemcibacter aquimaris TaxID=2857064 RepID=UPI0020122B69|nr:uracil-DNA glycosylase [Pseudemcibacter aquimaris]MCC3860653.1 uracil-DNA glycosylase [Pseudemcibacter aquimaris]WDU59472.1 uracil-DNA glycosylase [Pseudemcibacter aquimaris]
MANMELIRDHQSSLPGNAPLDCEMCPRLVAFRNDNIEKYPDYFNGPVPAFGAQDAELLIVGLAPGLKGANRTGRPFTGDYAGDLLYPTLIKFGFANGTYDSRIEDGLTMKKAIITNAVRCVPPQNKTIGEEERNCRPFLIEQIEKLPTIRIILALGLVAHNAVLSTYGEKKSAFKFAHNQMHTLSNGLTMIDSYHCSRYNTNTGRLTTEMFEDVFTSITQYLK